MPTDSVGRLRIHGHGDIAVEDAEGFLAAMSEAYNSVYAFDHALDILTDDMRYFSSFDRGRIGLRWYRDTFEQLTSSPKDVVPPSSHLILRSVRINSPGFWEFFGKLNPLEVLRLYLNDRHERRKDKDYRESAEQEKLHLENELLRNKVFSERLDILHKFGVTSDDLTPLKNRLVHGPLEKLSVLQDRKIIDRAEILRKDGDVDIG